MIKPRLTESIKKELPQQLNPKSTPMKRLLTLIVGLLCLHIVTPTASGQNSATMVSSVKGQDYYANTKKAIDELGGIKQFVKKGQTVGILVNSDFEIKGAYVNPDVTIAFIKLCLDAGAKEVVCLQNIKQEYWERSEHYAKNKKMFKKVRSVIKNSFPSAYNDTDFVRVDTLAGAKHIKDLEVVKELFNVDVFVNIPIAKNHTSTILTNSMKNMMGLTTRKTNVTFHLNGPKRNDPEFLATCIAELNLVRKPNLILVDATEVITTNGPVGPGDMAKPLRVVAGTDPVAIDAYCTTLLGFDPSRVFILKKGHELGLGEMDMSKVNIRELEGK